MSIKEEFKENPNLIQQIREKVNSLNEDTIQRKKDRNDCWGEKLLGKGIWD